MVLFSLQANAWSNKSTINVVSLEMPGYAEQNGTGVYWDIIRAVYGDEYQLNLIATTALNYQQHIKNKAADIFISTQSTTAGVLNYSAQHIDIKYGVYLLHIDENDDHQTTKPLTIAARKDQYLQSFAPQGSTIYQMESIENIHQLVNRKRIDAALSYSFNLHLSDPTGKLHEDQIAEAQKVFLGFNDLALPLKSQFETTFPKLLAKGDVASLFPTISAYEHANFFGHADKQKVYWNIVPKRFNEQTKELNVLNSEMAFTQQVEPYLNDVDLHITVNSMRRLKQSFIEADNICVLNIMKTSKRESFALFSKPSYSFLKPKLIMKNNVSDAHNLQRLSEQGELDFFHLMTQRPQLKITVIKGSNTHQVLNKHFGQAINDYLYLKDNTSINQTFSLMMSDRVDAVITWPSLISFLIDDVNIADSLVSYNLAGFNTPEVVSHIACSKSDIGKEVIDQFNKVMADEKHRNAILKAEYDKLDVNSAQELKRLMSSFYQ